MDSKFLIVSCSNFELYKELEFLVNLIRENKHNRLFYSNLYKYYNLIFSNFDVICYFVDNCSRSCLEMFLLDDDIDNFLEVIHSEQ